MNNLKVDKIVLEELKKLVLPTDEIKEVEPITDKHYSLNLRFEVIRNGKNYFITIKKVNVMGMEKKHHIRLVVNTDLPSNEKQEKIKKQKDLLDKKLAKIEELRIKIKEHKQAYILAKNNNTGNTGYHLYQYNEYKKQLLKLETSINR